MTLIAFVGFVARDGEAASVIVIGLVSTVSPESALLVLRKDDGVQQFIFGRMLWINESDWNTGFTRIGQMSGLSSRLASVTSMPLIITILTALSYEIGNIPCCAVAAFCRRQYEHPYYRHPFSLGSAGVKKICFTGYTISAFCQLADVSSEA